MVFGEALLVFTHVICKTLKCCHVYIPRKSVSLKSFQTVDLADRQQGSSRERGKSSSGRKSPAALKKAGISSSLKTSLHLRVLRGWCLLQEEG